MLSTLSALYGHLAETGAVAANPAALHRGRLGLSSTARDASPTVRLTAAQLARAAARGGRAAAHAATRGCGGSTPPARSRSSPCSPSACGSPSWSGSTAATCYRSGGDDVLRVLGKGGQPPRGLRHRARRDGAGAPTSPSATASPAPPPRPPRGRTAARASPADRHPRGRPLLPAVDLYTLLRRIAAHAGPELDGVADRVHPHALRHAYVTIALEQDARIHHVQADVGHASIATTQHYDRGLRTRSTTAADLVAAAIAAVPLEPRGDDRQVSSVRGLTRSAVRTTTRGAVPDRFMTRRR